MIGPFTCLIEWSAGRTEARLVDLSLGGGFVDLVSPARPGDEAWIEIRAHGERARLRARVAYVDPVQGFALRFMDPEPEALAALERILEKGPP